MNAIIRLATLDDADGVGRVHAQAWRETYAGMVSDRWVAGVSDAERITTWRRILGEPNPATQWVAVVDGAIVGFAASGPPRNAAAVRGIELWSLYVLRQHHRAGIGGQLLLASVGEGPASLWVAETNIVAQAFYTDAGFTSDGTRIVVGRLDGITELRMVR